jgi:predicted SprT family Zn-dependent metalloprotease
MLLGFTAMAVDEAASLCRQLMNEWELYDWTFGWNNRTTALGVTNYRNKTITLSKPLTEVNSLEEMRDTILHEIAHAKAGNQAGHGPVWKSWARTVGANPERTTDTAVSVAPKIIGTCPNCGETVGQQRMPRKAWAHPQCNTGDIPFDDRRFVWSRVDGKPVKQPLTWAEKRVDDAVVNMKGQSWVDKYGPDRIGT